MKRSESPGAGGAGGSTGPVAVPAAVPVAKIFFSSPNRPALAARASRPGAKKMDLQGENGGMLETVPNSSLCGSSFDPNTQVSPERPPAPAPAAVASPTRELGEAKPLGANGGGGVVASGPAPAKAAAATAQRSSGKLSDDARSPVEEFPPMIDALSMGREAAEGSAAQARDRESSREIGGLGVSGVSPAGVYPAGVSPAGSSPARASPASVSPASVSATRRSFTIKGERALDLTGSWQRGQTGANDQYSHDRARSFF